MQRNVERVIEKYSDMVYRIALTRLGNVENAEDIYQEVFLKYSEKSPDFKNDEHEKAWLIRVTINLTKNLKKFMNNKSIENLNENILFETPEESEIFSVVCDLPQNYKTVVYLFYYEGYKVNEIAKLMDTKEGTIKTWLYRAREILRENLEGGFENE